MNISKISWKKIQTRFRFKYTKRFKKTVNNVFWFSTGAFLSLLFIIGLFYFIYQKIYENKVYPGIFVNGIAFGGKTEEDVKNYFDARNETLDKTVFQLTSDYGIATVSAREINLGYDSNLLSVQTYSLGRSSHVISDISLLLQAYFGGIHLSPTYTYSEDKLNTYLNPIKSKIEKMPVDAQFKFENNRVTAFQPSEEGRTLDMEKLNKSLNEKTLTVVTSSKPQIINIKIPIKIIYPNITTEKANNLGIKELIGQGHSLFYHSIQGRIYNIDLASSRIDGVLVAPDEIFSFNKALGDVSAFTGYKQAYIIQNGRTVLGDGGGVCQVSTTFFRAILNAGLPIVERTAHAYRVSYYEQDSPPGIDATIYVPTVDLKFKNDTGNYILVQREIDLNNLSLSFRLYGTKDGREVSMTKPVITNQTPAPEPLYQDDPTLPVGEIKQVDFAASGANVYFTRTVTKNGKTIIFDKFVSNYRPWQAVYTRGTKQ